MTKKFLISVALVSISFLAGCASNPKNEESCFEVRKTSMTVATLRYELGAPKAQAAEMASQNVPEGNPSKPYLKSIIEDAYSYQFGKISPNTFGYYEYVACKNGYNKKLTKPIAEIQDKLAYCEKNKSNDEEEQCLEQAATK